VLVCHIDLVASRDEMEGLGLAFICLGFGAVYLLLAIEVFTLITNQKSRPKPRAIFAVLAAGVWPVAWPLIIVWRSARKLK
jgi:hypothetical protein